MPASRRPRWLRTMFQAAAPLLFVVALFAWGMSTAVGGTPDEDFHLASVWCGHGENPPACGEETTSGQREVSRGLVLDSVCYAFEGEISASCQGDSLTTDLDDRVNSARGNFTGLYPPVFYFALSWLSGSDVEFSVLIMRGLNAILFTGLIALIVWLLPPRRRTTLVWGITLTIVPLGMFIIPSVNPSSWAVLSGAALLASLLGVGESEGGRRVGLGATALLSALLGSGARGDAALFAVLAVIVALILTDRAGRRSVILLATSALVVLISATFTLVSRQGSAAAEGLGGELNPGIGPFALAGEVLIELPALWAGVFGAWPLGWVDTTLPASVWVLSFAAFCGALFWGINRANARRALATLIMLAALIFFPLVLLVRSHSLVGQNFQPRYLLPLVVMLGVVMLWDQAGRPNPSSLVRWVIVLALGTANAVALHTNIRRYVTGTDDSGGNLDSGVEWWWDLPVSPLTTWFIGTAAFAGFLAIIASTLWTRTLEEEESGLPVRAVDST